MQGEMRPAMGYLIKLQEIATAFWELMLLIVHLSLQKTLYWKIPKRRIGEYLFSSYLPLFPCGKGLLIFWRGTLNIMENIQKDTSKRAHHSSLPCHFSKELLSKSEVRINPNHSTQKGAGSIGQGTQRAVKQSRYETDMVSKAVPTTASISCCLHLYFGESHLFLPFLHFIGGKLQQGADLYRILAQRHHLLDQSLSQPNCLHGLVHPHQQQHLETGCMGMDEHELLGHLWGLKG
mmetsp:Transcript_20065/g.26506  ORF Transcript_20065/g.26506 Transcript_20065/m.26506 type:complete len:235 (+) Transcript_20065:1048-1752(+)